MFSDYKDGYILCYSALYENNWDLLSCFFDENSLNETLEEEWYLYYSKNTPHLAGTTLTYSGEPT